MADDKQGFSVSGASFISVVAAVLVAGFFGQHLLLRDTRPTSEATGSGASGIQQIDARLWEDPLDATQRFREAHSARGAGTPWACAPAEAAQSAEPVIIALIPGGPYDQAAETRRRTRYAVLSALHAESYQPVDPEHLGCFAYPGVETASADNPQAQQARDRPPSVVPYERFESDRANKAPKEVAVVWLDENKLRDANHPYAVLTGVRDALRAALSMRPVPAPDAPVRIIGPYNSLILEKFIKACKSETAPPSIEKFEFYIYAATMEPKTSPDCSGASFIQVVNTDDKLAARLADEMSRRRVNPRIALVSEFDTAYGRELTRTVATMFETHCGNLGQPPQACTVDTLTYLRGLDGSLPKLSPASSDDTDASAGSASAATSSAGLPDAASRARAYQPAEGNAQLDYLERLPGPLRQLERDDEAGRGPYAAIGLLGNDVYDKLLLLRALKPRFPDAVFFTTDLDARLFDPAEFATTRGLVVASAFGPRLAPAWQAQTPSFRDSYQAAAFLAGRLAAGDCGSELKTARTGLIQQSVNEWHRSALLYEIGRWGAVPLPLSSSPSKTGCPGEGAGLAAVQVAMHQNVPPYTLTPVQKLGLFCLGVAAWGLLVFEFRLFHYRATAAALTLLMFTGLLLAGASPGGEFVRGLLTQHGGGEPLSLTNGVSLWPVVGARLLGAVFCYFAIWRVIDKLRGNGTYLEEHFALPSFQPHTSNWARWMDAARVFYHGVEAGWKHVRSPKPAHRCDAWGGSIYDGDTNEYRGVGDLWRRLSPSSMIPRLYRSGVYTAIALVLVVLLCLACPTPHIPARGAVVWWMYWLATVANLGLMQFLIMLVFDATRISSHVTRAVRAIETSHWPARVCASCGGKSGLEGPVLADWIDIQMIATRTNCITGLVYFPFAALAILMISQSGVFDAVPIYPPIVALAAGAFGLLAYIVLCLRGEAESSRSSALDRLDQEVLHTTSTGDDPRHLKEWRKQLRDFKQGAFRPFFQQPLLRAILLPLSSLGGSALLQQILSP